MAGDQQTDLQRPASFYRRPNGLALLAPRPMADPVAGEATSIAVGGRHAFAGSWIGHAKLGYFESKNDGPAVAGPATARSPTSRSNPVGQNAARLGPALAAHFWRVLLTGAVFARWAAIYRWAFPERSGRADFSGT